METEFFTLNQWLWQHPGDARGVKRGFGWFAFKPFVIMDALDHMDDGDIAIFTDADTYPTADLSPLYIECHRIHGLMLFGSCGWEGYHNIWCKRDCFIVMGQDAPRYWYSDHGCARFVVVEKGPWLPKQFLMEWLTYSINPLATTFDASVLGIPEIASKEPGVGPWGGGFHEHRCEQAILTNLAHKHNVKLYREACQWGETCSADKELYPTLFRHDGRVGPKTLAGSAYRNVPCRNN